VEKLTSISLIVGLGNPGLQYEGTRHNIGFDVLDRYVQKQGLEWSKHKAWNALWSKSSGVYLLKPQTFMNLSGVTTQQVCQYFKIPVQQMMVVYDDVDLGIGNYKLKAQGSAAGHNGIKSIIERHSSDQFARLKIGIAGVEQGRPKGERMADYVLGKWREEEKLELERLMPKFLEILKESSCNDFEALMNLYNQKNK
jgi:PTH1 family peptidyl-tRNA hydrolase